MKNNVIEDTTMAVHLHNDIERAWVQCLEATYDSEQSASPIKFAVAQGMQRALAVIVGEERMYNINSIIYKVMPILSYPTVMSIYNECLKAFDDYYEGMPVIEWTPEGLKQLMTEYRHILPKETYFLIARAHDQLVIHSESGKGGQ